MPPPEKPLARFAANACPTKLVESDPDGPLGGRLVVAMFGDEKPLTAPDDGVRAGRTLMLVDPASGEVEPLPTAAPIPLARPIDVAFHPVTGTLFALDFGEFELGAAGQVWAKPGSGRIVEIPLGVAGGLPSSS